MKTYSSNDGALRFSQKNPSYQSLIKFFSHCFHIIVDLKRFELMKCVSNMQPYVAIN